LTRGATLAKHAPGSGLHNGSFAMRAAHFAAAVLFTTGLSVGLPARAQDRPTLLAPSRDVAVVYRTEGGMGGPPGNRGASGGGHEIRMYFSNGGMLMRVETNATAQQAYMIVDRTAQRTTMVMPAQHMYVDMPSRGPMQNGMVLTDDMQFRRTGTDTIAGIGCTVWEAHGPRGDGSACITDDGVMLRAKSSDGRGLMEATQVSYGPQSPTLFQPPAGFTRMQMPAGMPPGGAHSP
jgi:hypothetical protein